MWIKRKTHIVSYLQFRSWNIKEQYNIIHPVFLKTLKRVRLTIKRKNSKEQSIAIIFTLF